MTITSEQQAAFAKMLVNAAKQKEVTLRVIGGVAVYATCPSIATHPKLQRTIKDVDFIAPRGDWNALEGIFAANGLKSSTKGKESWVFEKDGLVVEVCDPNFGFANFTRRLTLATPTLPLTDLLLIKLARRPFEERDIQDAIALLLDHSVARSKLASLGARAVALTTAACGGLAVPLRPLRADSPAPGGGFGMSEAEGQISHEYIARLCAHNWKLFHAVYDNTVTLEKVLDQYGEPAEAQRVWRRIELIQGDMDQQPKSLGWMVNQFLRKPTEVPR